MIKILKMDKEIKFSNINIKEFEALSKTYYSELCRFALKYTKNEENAEETVQDVFFHLWEKKKKIIINTSVKSYSYIAVRNKCLQEINHKKVIRKYENSFDSGSEINKEDPSDEMIYSESIEIFNEALNSMPEKCRTIFKMSRFDGMKYLDIASELSVSVKTVELYISKALKHFRQYFPEYAFKN
jgi:RNA polymerase sigma-70 factor (ECF subfamily)